MVIMGDKPKVDDKESSEENDSEEGDEESGEDESSDEGMFFLSPSEIMILRGSHLHYNTIRR
jgi:hypothetical protein